MSTSPAEATGQPGAKVPRTERGRRTLRKLLDAAAQEFGEKGFHDASISGITRRAGTALGSFYTYFDSKDAIFRALVNDMSERVGAEARRGVTAAPDAVGKERAALAGFLAFAREHKELYRIIDEAEFVDEAIYRAHYEGTAARIYQRLKTGMATGELRDDLTEADAWAIMGMNVFLGLRYVVFSDEHAVDDIADVAGAILSRGIAKD